MKNNNCCRWQVCSGSEWQSSFTWLCRKVESMEKKHLKHSWMWNLTGTLPL